MTTIKLFISSHTRTGIYHKPNYNPTLAFTPDPNPGLCTNLGGAFPPALGLAFFVALVVLVGTSPVYALELQELGDRLEML